MTDTIHPTITVSSTLTTPSEEGEKKVEIIEDSQDAPSVATLEMTSGATVIATLYPESDEWKAREKALVRKNDLRLMPILVILYILNYLDRNSISAARDNGLQANLQLTDVQYSTALSVMWAGYIAFQVPSNILMTKLDRPSLSLPFFVALWGLVSGLTAVTNSYKSLLAVRVSLGICEAAFFPGAIALMGYFYRKAEVATRIAIFFSGMALSSAFGGVIAAGIVAGMEGTCGIAAWRWLFVLEGAVTVGAANFAVFILPDMPYNSKFLNEEEKALAIARLALDVGTSLSANEVEQEEPSATECFIMTVKDVKVWILTFMLLSCVIGLGFLQFFPTLVGSLNYSHITTLLLTTPNWFFAFLVCVGTAFHSDRKQERALHIVAPLVLSIIGFIIAATTLHIVARFISLFIQTAAFAGYILILGWIAPSIPAPKYKKTIAVALINSISQIGMIISSYSWPKVWGPTYWRSYTISTVCFTACIMMVFVHRWVLKRENAELDLIKSVLENEGAEGDKDGSDVESSQPMTKKQKQRQVKLSMAQSSFRYML